MIEDKLPPSWEHSPNWAHFRTMDRDGVYHWWERTPERDDANGIWVGAGKRERCDGRVDWWSSLNTVPNRILERRQEELK